MINYTKKQRFLVERTIMFLVNEVEAFCRNKKPVILHSIRVGMRCMVMERPVVTVIAALLHDLLEDTKCTEQKIKKHFGKRVALYVRALTMDYSFPDYKARWHDNIDRLRRIGPEVILIKALDILDNSPYYQLISHDKKFYAGIRWRATFFRCSFSRELKSVSLYNEYKRMLDRLK